MSKFYTDYINRTALTVPDKFIDVKSGETHIVSPEVFEQIEYHAENQTLMHLVLSALNEYFQPRRVSNNNEVLLQELGEIKQMLQGYQPTLPRFNLPIKQSQPVAKDLNMKEVEDILEVFGG